MKTQSGMAFFLSGFKLAASHIQNNSGNFHAITFSDVYLQGQKNVPYIWELRSSGLWPHVVLKVITATSEEPAVSVFGLEVKLEAGASYKTLVTTYDTTCFIT
jgi:hypothetical protein